ncbi:sulfite exporter TauE/SafE family protein [Lentisphaera profundi]|uniref:Sulfite exporter TauE/SafE family protein n=1 Tax=Lentisphaera profundi TaxID=1658616 RepID=A0ABY7VR65_9BACT|nr:sulfite exporter TauE/SafE family protein [Lentisphaera profundi]WDE95725.1 sulfite exporter TauE/SafE family protein [Lentisphaera profundi]
MTTILSSFILGLAVSLHCAGMCGPLMCAKFSNGNKFVASHFCSLQLGRLTTYGILGLIIALTSKMISLGLYQNRISVITGLLILVVYFAPMKIKRRVMSHFPQTKWNKKLRQSFGKLMGSQSLGGNYALGILNGLLPCGVVYVALGASLTAESPIHGVLMMVAFGLGNIPVLLMSAGAGRLIANPRVRAMTIPLAVLMTGSLLILRGMDLGIPYVSPHLEQETGKVASCCEH